MIDNYRQININLQLFSGEKTEKATSRQRTKARSKGQVTRSVELNSALILLLSFFMLKIFSPYMLEQMTDFSRYMFTNLDYQELSWDTLVSFFSISALTISKTILPIVAVALIGGVAANIMQVGFQINTEPLMPNLNRINLISGMKRFVSLRSFVELLKATLKIIIVGYVAYGAIKKDLGLMPQLMDMGVASSLGVIAKMTWDLVLRIGIILLILSIFDYAYQKWEYEKSIRMSKQDIKEEYKTMEGDPKVKAAIRSKQRQVSMRRMMQDVPKADVIITNPTHFAVALQYDEKTMTAPTVTAKGQDYIALRIRAVAEENRVPLVENPPLAQSLYRSAEIGQEVPGDLYQAVAEVLAFVYRLKGRI